SLGDDGMGGGKSETTPFATLLPSVIPAKGGTQGNRQESEHGALDSRSRGNDDGGDPGGTTRPAAPCDRARSSGRRHSRPGSGPRISPPRTAARSAPASSRR